MTFVGRVKELRKLEELYSMEGSATCAIYGRRRVGKTTLIREFCKGKKHIFLTSTSSGAESTLFNYSRIFSAYYGSDLILSNEYDVMTRLYGVLNREEKVVIVIDEFPFLADCYPSFPSLLQRFIDHDMSDNPSMLILCGSSMGAMSRMLNDGEGPLFMRFPIQMKLGPLSYPESRMMHPGYSEEDRIRAYAIAGGIPMYHQQLEGKVLERKVEDCFLDESGFLRSEAERVLFLELSPWETYEKILFSLGNGEAKIDDISKRTGLSKTMCRKLLDNMVLLGVVAEEASFGKVRNNVFRIVDGITGFYYSVLARSDTVAGSSLGASYDSIRRNADTFYGRRFEDICRQYVLSTNACRWIGRWWGSIPEMEFGKPKLDENGKVIVQEADVDIVALAVNKDSEDLILCECKFTRRKADVTVLRVLEDRAEVIRKNDRNKRYVLFSRSGFTDELWDEVLDRDDSRVELVDLDKFAEWAESVFPVR